MNTQSKYLHFVAYKDIPNWSVGYISGHTIGFTQKYPMVKIGKFLHRNKTSVDIQDDVLYKRVTIKTLGGGICLRDTEKGTNIGTKKQFLISKGQFLVSKIDARNGAFGVVPDEVDGAIITGNFWTYDVDESLINPYFLAYLTSTKTFARFSETASVGTTNRRYLQEDLFLQQQIPLPSLAEQQALVDAYNHNLQQANDLEQQAENGEKEIENIIMQRLGITIPKIETSKKGLSFVSYKEVQDRWDLYNAQTSIFAALAKATYKAQQIGSIYNFITRGWKKTEDKFRYIELGSVDAADGIMSASELLVKDAPSRATQKVSEGDLILGTTRPYLKKFAIVPQEFTDCVCSSGFQVIANNSTNNLQFLYEYLKTPAAIAQYEYFMTGALYPAITNTDLKKVEIPLPPLDVQAEIVAVVQEQRTKIVHYKSLATTLRQEAITQFEHAIFE